jgi:arylsulfatase A-like enzyme
LYPWRLGIKGVYEYGKKCNKGHKCSNRDDWLAQIPTSAMIFKDVGYTTIHSGKWHLGGMR